MIFGISKTTLNGVLALFITVLSSVMAYQVPSAMLSPGQQHTWLWITGICNLLCGVLRAVVGFLQTDSPSPAK